MFLFPFLYKLFVLTFIIILNVLTNGELFEFESDIWRENKLPHKLEMIKSTVQQDDPTSPCERKADMNPEKKNDLLRTRTKMRMFRWTMNIAPRENKTTLGSATGSGSRGNSGNVGRCPGSLVWSCTEKREISLHWDL